MTVSTFLFFIRNNARKQDTRVSPLYLSSCGCVHLLGDDFDGFLRASPYTVAAGYAN